MLVWFGIQEALASSRGGQGFDMARFLNFFILITFAYTFVLYYDSSIPGIGYSLKSFISDGTTDLANIIGHDATASMLQSIDASLQKSGPGMAMFTAPYMMVAYLIEAIAKDYVAKPENTLVVSPDNASRQEINNAIRAELQASGVVSKENHSMNVLTPRSDMTSVDRSWAARYQPDDVLHYTRGSKEHGIEKGSYATVVSVNHKENQITVQKPDGLQATYDPKRLQGIAAYREIDRDFAQGDRIQFTANNRELAVSNRDMGTIERIDANQVSVKMDDAKERTVSFDAAQMRHFDHGYAVTSHSSQGLTADRVLVNMDTKVHPELINTRFASRLP